MSIESLISGPTGDMFEALWQLKIFLKGGGAAAENIVP
jgi:hypothetical protein